MRTEAAKAAQIIRKHLKDNGITAKVTSQNYAGGNSINVKTFDLLPATEKFIKYAVNVWHEISKLKVFVTCEFVIA